MTGISNSTNKDNALLILKQTIECFLKKIDTTGSIERSTGSGRPRSARTEENMQYVQEEF